MDFRLVEQGWDKEFDTAAAGCRHRLCIVAPFLQVRAVERLLVNRPPELRVITRFNLDEFYGGVNSLDALRRLLDAGAKIKGVRNLHAKAYLFDDSLAVVTSANLTTAALVRNHELGFVTGEPALVAECQKYFGGLWGRGGHVLTRKGLDEMERVVSGARAKGTNVVATTLGDLGTDAGFVPATLVSPAGFPLGAEAYVKFSAVSEYRRERSTPVLSELERSGMHWACSYPAGRRPRQPKEGDTMFLSVLTGPPSNDITIYGRAIVLRSHDEARDVASPVEIEKRDWKDEWPNYIRVHSGEFVAGTLENGISLGELMDTFGAFSFAPTERRALEGEEDVDPRAALKQKPSIHLSQRAKSWLNSELEARFATHGTLTQSELATLDWPQPTA